MTENRVTQNRRVKLDAWTLGSVVIIVLVLAIAGLSFASQPEVSTTATTITADKVEEVAGTDLHRITLTEKAADRLDIQTEPVQTAVVAGQPRTLIPYAAVLYDAAGATWTYTNPEPLVFVRHAITVERIDDEDAVLTAGPPAGAEVVTVGGAELYGSEYGVGH
jgi:hypothetical protein